MCGSDEGGAQLSLSPDIVYCVDKIRVGLWYLLTLCKIGSDGSEAQVSLIEKSGTQLSLFNGAYVDQMSFPLKKGEVSALACSASHIKTALHLPFLLHKLHIDILILHHPNNLFFW